MSNSKEKAALTAAADEFVFDKAPFLSDEYLWITVKNPKGETVVVIHKNSIEEASGYLVECFVDSEAMRKNKQTPTLTC